MANYDLSDIGEKHDLSDLGGTPVNNVLQDNQKIQAGRAWDPGLGGLVKDLANAPGTNAVLGFGDAIRNMMGQTASVLPGVNIPDVKSAEGTAYNIGKVGGEIAGFLGGGEALDAIRAASKGAPLIGRLAKGLEGSPLKDALRRVTGSAAYGAIESPDDRLGGAAKGAALGSAAEVIPGLTGVLTKPGKSAKGIQDYIAEQKNKAEDLYKKVREVSGNEKIYKQEIPVYGAVKNIGGKYEKLDKDIFDINKDIKELHSNFSDNPTFENAHKLQSRLGKEMGNLKGKVLDEKAAQRINELRSAREAIKDDMHSYLISSEPELADKFKKASDIYKNIVDPTNKLSKIFNPTTKDVANVLGKIEKKGIKSGGETVSSLSPELRDQLSGLNRDRFKQALAATGLSLGLGGLGYGIMGGHISPSSLLEGIIAGKLLGVKAPRQTGDSMQRIVGNIGQGAQGLGDVLKATMLRQQ